MQLQELKSLSKTVQEAECVTLVEMLKCKEFEICILQ